MASIEVFCCYAHQDIPHLENLKSHLTLLRRQGLISLWTDTNISPGSNWEKEIEKHLNTAHLILLLISSDFLTSDYCYSREMLQAIERHDRGEARVIPIIVRPVYWQGAPFARLQVLPTHATPIMSSSWHSFDEAWLDVVKGIGEAIKSIQITSSQYYHRLTEYVTQEIQKGMTISNVLTTCDPLLEILFKAIIGAASRRIAEVTQKGKPIRIALNDCSPELASLFEVAQSNLVDNEDPKFWQAKIEKLLHEISAVGDGDLRVQAEVTPDTLGVLADTINFLIEELAKVVIHIQRTTTAVTKHTDLLLTDIQAQKQSIMLITQSVKGQTFSLYESKVYTAIAQETKQLDTIIAHEASQTKKIKELLDQLYGAVSTLRLPQERS